MFIRFSECGLLPWSLSSPWFHDTDCPLSTGGGGAGSHLRDVHHCQRNSHSPPIRAHYFSHHYSQKVNCVFVYKESVQMESVKYWHGGGGAGLMSINFDM